MKGPPNIRPSYKTVKISLKTIARNDMVIEKLTEVAVMANKMMIHTLQLMKLYFLDYHSKSKPFPKVTRSLVTGFMKTVCRAPKIGSYPRASTKQMKDEINEFYQLHYRHLQT